MTMMVDVERVFRFDEELAGFEVKTNAPPACNRNETAGDVVESVVAASTALVRDHRTPPPPPPHLHPAGPVAPPQLQRRPAPRPPPPYPPTRVPDSCPSPPPPPPSTAPSAAAAAAAARQHPAPNNPQPSCAAQPHTARFIHRTSVQLDEMMNIQAPAEAAERRHPRVDRFIIGASDSESDSDSETVEMDVARLRKRLSASGSSQGSFVGGAPTNMDFELDDQSSCAISDSQAAFFMDELDLATEKDAADPVGQLVPLKAVDIGVKASLKSRRNRHHNFAGYYRLTEDHLGSGAYASVRTALAADSGKEYAVKVVDKEEPGHTRSRIMREVEIFKMCRNHPNIVHLVEWFEDEKYFYMVFEKMRGGPLLNHIQRKVCFTEQEASKVTRDIANALKYLHERGVAHRDVKPENILCTDLDRVSPVKLCDLDLASKPSLHLRKTSRTLHNVHSEPDLASPVGSAEFMAPEVVDTFVGDALKYDKRCDMWSLGVIIYIMLCGYTPFYGECGRENCGWDQGQPCNDCQDSLFHRIQRGEFDFPDEDWANISEQAKDLIKHLLVKNVRQRYTATDVLHHSWVCGEAPKTLLQTANNLFRNDSARDVHQMNEHFNVMNRLTSCLRFDELPQADSSSGDELIGNDLVEVPELESQEEEHDDNMENIPIDVPVPERKTPAPESVPVLPQVVEEQTKAEEHAAEPLHQVQLAPQATPALNTGVYTMFAQPAASVFGNVAPHLVNQQPAMFNVNGMLVYGTQQTVVGHNGQAYFNFYQPACPVYPGNQSAYVGRFSQQYKAVPNVQRWPQPAPLFQQQQHKSANKHHNNFNWWPQQNVRGENVDGKTRRARGMHTERRSLTPGYLQHHQHGLHHQKQVKRTPAHFETCQNAMVRQESAHDLVHRQPHREGQVHV